MPLTTYQYNILARDARDTGTHLETKCPACLHPGEKFRIDKTEKTFHCFHCQTPQVPIPRTAEDKSEGVPEDPTGVYTPQSRGNIAPGSISVSWKYVNACIEQMKENRYRHLGLTYLVAKRHLTKAIIDYFKLGYDPRENAIVIPSFNHERLYGVSLRYLDPDAPTRYKSWGVKGLYNAGYLLMNTRSCVLFEGELDTVSSIQLIPNLPAFATQGKNIHKPGLLKAFGKYERVYICYDEDGYDEATQLAEKLGDYRCYRVKIPKPYKDLNEMLSQPNAKEIYSEALATAKCVGKPLLADIKDFMKSALSYHTGARNKSTSTGYGALDEICGGIRPGELTVLTGPTGVGKSTTVISLAFNLAKAGIRSMVGSFELPVDSHVLPKIVSFALKRNIHDPHLPVKDYRRCLDALIRWGQMGFINRVGSLSIPELEYSLISAYKQGFRFFVLDHLNYFISPSVDAQVVETDATMILLQKMVKEVMPEAHIVLVVHPKKLGSCPKTGISHRISIQDLKGSSRISQDADNVWIINKGDGIVDLTVAKLRSDAAAMTAGGMVTIGFNKQLFQYTMSAKIEALM